MEPERNLKKCAEKEEHKRGAEKKVARFWL